MPEPIVEMKGVTKTYGAFHALDAVDLAVMPQTIHAVVGENGAGKTTLMKVLFGSTSADQGTVKVRGRERHYRSQADAAADRIGMVSQHYGIVPELTNLENLILGAEPAAVVDHAAARTRADQLAARLGFSFDWTAPSADLSPAAAQKLEILKLLWRDAEIMILDEPTSMLSPQDSDALFESLHQLVAEGATVIVVTHRLPEVLQHCSHVTVLRGGKQVADRPVAGVDSQELTELIVGRSVHIPDPRSLAATPEVLSVKGLQVGRSVQGASLTLHEGEVVGLAGVDGNGQRELFQALFGVVKPDGGSMWLKGKNVTGATTRERIAAGFRLVAEDRLEEGVVNDWSVQDNVVLGHQRTTAARGSLLDQAVTKPLAEAVVAKFGARVQRISQPMSGLSGGNQQRVVVARALVAPVSVLLAFQPSRGLDVDATARVYQAFREVEGGATLVVSFDLDELLTFCDRILVIHAGHIVAPPEGKERDRQAIGALMVGT